MPLSPAILEKKDANLHMQVEESPGEDEIQGTSMEKWKKLIYGDDYNSAATFLESPVSAPPLYGNQQHQPTSSTEKWRRLIYGDDYVDDQLIQDRETPSRTKSRGNDEKKWERMIYGDKYFDNNIAAITSDWEDEDYGYPSKYHKVQNLFHRFKNVVLDNRGATGSIIFCIFMTFLFIASGVHLFKPEPEPVDPFVTKSVTPGSRLRPVQHPYIDIVNNGPDDDSNRRLVEIDVEESYDNILGSTTQNDLI